MGACVVSYQLLFMHIIRSLGFLAYCIVAELCPNARNITDVLVQSFPNKATCWPPQCLHFCIPKWITKYLWISVSLKPVVKAWIEQIPQTGWKHVYENISLESTVKSLHTHPPNPHGANEAREAQVAALHSPCHSPNSLRHLQEEMPASQGYLLKAQEQPPDPNSISLCYVRFLRFILSHATLFPVGHDKNLAGGCFIYCQLQLLSAAASDRWSPISCIHVFLIILLWLFIYWSPTNTEGIISCNIQFGPQILSISVHYRCSACGSTGII